MKISIVIAAMLAALGCNKSDDGASRTDEAKDSPPVAADNTAKNERDQHGEALTPPDQRENSADLAITQQVRQDVVKGDDISSAGKNVKIITVDGVVTLRGPVGNAQEKQEIATLARKVQGVKRVDNQLEVANK